MTHITEATRKETHELYTIFRILSDGFVCMGDEEGNAGHKIPVALVVREEKEGTRRFLITQDTVVCEGFGTFPRSHFEQVSITLLLCLQQPLSYLDLSELVPFFEQVGLRSLNHLTQDQTHLKIALWNPDSPLIGVRIEGALCGMTPLLPGSRLTNLKWEQTGVRFSRPAVNKINVIQNAENVIEVVRRILYIEEQGGILKYADVCDRVFKSNLLMIDTNLPRILASMVRTTFMDGITTLHDHIEILNYNNPLKMKAELVDCHHFYAHKLRQFLLALAWGMRPTKTFDGTASHIAGYLMVDAAGMPLFYGRTQEQVFGDYLLQHTVLKQESPQDAKYGLLERENNAYYVKLNLSIAFAKRKKRF